MPPVVVSTEHVRTTETTSTGDGILPDTLAPCTYTDAEARR